MEPAEKELTPEQSLHLIRSMIDQTRGAVVDNSFYFLLWGWVVFACSTVQYCLKTWQITPYHYAVWFLMPVAGVVSAIYGARQAKKQRVKSFVGDAIKALWIAIALAFVTLIVVNIVREDGWKAGYTYYILMYALGTFVTGKLIHFRPLVIGGLINFVLAMVAGMLAYEHQLLVCAFAILTSYIIPGHMLRARFNKQKQVV